MLRRWELSNTGKYVGLFRTLYRSRCYSSFASERVEIGSQGSVKLDLYQPSSRQANSTGAPTVLIYLPRGPYCRNEAEDESTVSTLCASKKWTIVRINYRLSPDWQYPTPIHDVLAGYDWVLSNVLPKRAITRPGRSEHVGRLAVCGELVGGGLATMLALTECRVGEPGIAAAAVCNPIIDWTSVEDGTVHTKLSKRTSAALQARATDDTDKLLALRMQLFKRPADYFDTLASPMLLFRSAGKAIPPAALSLSSDDMDHLGTLEREDWLRQAGTNLPNADMDSSPADNVHGSKAERKSSRRFPSKSSRLRLPSFYITTGSASPMSSQANEFTHLLRQSMIRQSKHARSNSSDFGQKVLLEDEQEMDQDEEQLRLLSLQKAEAEERAHLQAYSGMGLWDSSKEGVERVTVMSKWLNRTLG